MKWTIPEKIIDEEGLDSDMQLLHVTSLEVNGISNKQDVGETDEWWEVLQVANGTLRCQLDTGACASVINSTQLQQVTPSAKIKHTKNTLVSYSHTNHTRGLCYPSCKIQGHGVKCELLCHRSKQKPVLSGKVCQAFNLVQLVHKIHVDANLKELRDKHQDLQNASGAMPETYFIKFDPTATSVVHGPRRQPASLLKIVAKLKEIENEGHLAKVTQPTDWVNYVVVSSRGENIRICLDPGDVNKEVKREHCPVPTVEEMAAKIPDFKVFTVLDAKSGFLQMKLDYECSLLTTMHTRMKPFVVPCFCN